MHSASDRDRHTSYAHLTWRRRRSRTRGEDNVRKTRAGPAVPVLALLAACGVVPQAGDGGAQDGSGGGGAATGGQSGGGGSAASGGAGSGGGPVPGAGGSASGGVGAAGGQMGAGGSAPGTCGGEPLLEAVGPVFSCGDSGHVFEAAGRADNRVNYALLGDGYDEALIETSFIEHVENMLHHETAGFYSAIGEPYARYRKFINVCGIKLASVDACIDNADIGRSCDTLFDGRCEPPCAASGTRLGLVDGSKVNAALAQEVPSDVDIDWVGVTLNADETGWWNSGGGVMVWNGAFSDRLQSASVALHEGGHTYHGLADEYGGTSQNCGEYQELNSTADPEAEKWAHWLGYSDERTDVRPRPAGLSGDPFGTFEQGAFEGSRYCDTGQYRPSEDSEMNLLPQPFNMPSMEKIILDIYAIVEPIDAHTDNTVPLVLPQSLQVRVVDAEVLTIEWSVDGALMAEESGECFLLPQLSPGEHEVSVRVADETTWVRRDRELLEQTVTWQVSVP
jgi:hypothetical protein